MFGRELNEENGEVHGCCAMKLPRFMRFQHLGLSNCLNLDEDPNVGGYFPLCNPTILRWVFFGWLLMMSFTCLSLKCCEQNARKIIQVGKIGQKNAGKL